MAYLAPREASARVQGGFFLKITHCEAKPCPQVPSQSITVDKAKGFLKLPTHRYPRTASRDPVIDRSVRSCLTLCGPMDCSPPGSSLPGIFPARILVWAIISFSRASSQPRDRTCVSSIAGGFFTAEPPGTTPIIDKKALFQCYVGMEGVPGRCAWRASGRRVKGLNCVILSAFPGRQGGQWAQIRTLRKPVLPPEALNMRNAWRSTSLHHLTSQALERGRHVMAQARGWSTGRKDG